MAKRPAKKTESSNLPATQAYTGKYAGADKGDFDQTDILMPRMKLGQALTPEVVAGNATTGDMIHNITQEIIAPAGEPLRVVYVAYNKEYILWRDRKTGGGIMARAKKVILPDGSSRFAWDKPNQTFDDRLGDAGIPVQYKTGKYTDEDGLTSWGSKLPQNPDSPPAATAHYNYVLMLPDRGNEMIAVSFSKSSEAKAKAWNSLLSSGDMPKFLRVYELNTYLDQKGDDQFANWSFSVDFTKVEDDLEDKLFELYTDLKSRGVQVDFSDEDTGGDAGDTVAL